MNVQPIKFTGFGQGFETWIGKVIDAIFEYGFEDILSAYDPQMFTPDKEGNPAPGEYTLCLTFEFSRLGAGEKQWIWELEKALIPLRFKYRAYQGGLIRTYVFSRRPDASDDYEVSYVTPRVRTRGVRGEYGNAGFLSEETHADLAERIPDLYYVLTEINLRIMDEVDSGSALGKKIARIPDYRVDEDVTRSGHWALHYPIEVYRDNKLAAFYESIVKDVLGSL